MKLGVGHLAAVTTMGAAALASVGPNQQATDVVALPRWFASLPQEFMVTGAKAEQSFTELVRYGRSGDTFVLEIDVLTQGDDTGGRERTVLAVDDLGTIHRRPCTASCTVDGVVQGHLATASLVAAARSGRLPATGTAHSYAGRRVVCVDNRALGQADPVVDPCFDAATGAELAQRSRRDGSFAGPTLLAGTITVTDQLAPHLLPHQKARTPCSDLSASSASPPCS